MSSIKVVDVSRVVVPATATLPPEPIRLSALDALWVVFPLIQRILFFEGDDLPPFDSLVHSLKTSLAATLAQFPPLAGKLAFLPSSGDIAITCSPADGVRFVTAESDADVRHLAGDEEHDVHAFERLVPELDGRELPAPVLAVQVTRLDGGVAVGVALHHSVADGRSVWMFLEAWAAACRGEPPAAAPLFDRSVIRQQGGEELARNALRKQAPHLPVAYAPETFVEHRMQFSRRTFTVDVQQAQRLKQRIVRIGEAHGAPLPHPPSSFVAIVALASTSIVRCKSFAADDDAYLFFFADCRARLDPPVDASYFGTCITGCMAKLPARDLLAEHGVAAAASAVQEEVRKAAEDPLAGWDWISTVLSIPWDRLVNIAGSPHFPAYEATDFGWGNPSRTELVTMNHDGQVVLVGAKGGDGVQVSVSLHPAHMDAFKAEFMHFLE